MAPEPSNGTLQSPPRPRLALRSAAPVSGGAPAGGAWQLGGPLVPWGAARRGGFRLNALNLGRHP